MVMRSHQPVPYNVFVLFEDFPASSTPRLSYFLSFSSVFSLGALTYSYCRYMTLKSTAALDFLTLTSACTTAYGQEYPIRVSNPASSKQEPFKSASLSVLPIPADGNPSVICNYSLFLIPHPPSPSYQDLSVLPTHPFPFPLPLP